MLALLKKKNPYAKAAHLAYGEVLKHTRKPVFYEDCGVPDTFDGRFDLMILHIYYFAPDA